MGFNELLDSGNSGGVETLHIMGVEYEMRFGETVIHLFCRLRDGTARWVEVTGHKPSFYIEDDAFTTRVQNNHKIDGYEGGWESLDGKPLKRIFTDRPKNISGERDEKGLRDYFDTTYEADVLYTTRFLIDNEIKTHIKVDRDKATEPNACRGDYQIGVEHVEPADVEWQATPRTVTIDIEVLSPNGFPEPSDAAQPVTAITAHDNYSDAYSVWLYRMDGVSWDADDIESIVRNRVSESVEDVFIFGDESRMLDDFNHYIEARNPDMLSGWNSSTTDDDFGDPFDFPYLINRCKNLNTYSFDKWSPLGEVWDSNWGPTVKGRAMFDMLKAYKKTQWQKPKGGYSLDNIASIHLERGKEDIDDIDDAYYDDVATFLEYNIRDVSAVVEIDEECGATDLYQNLRKLTGAQFGECHNNIDLLDQYILRFARDRNVALPTSEKPERGWFYGGYNFDPQFGRHSNAVYPDVWSEYPNAFRTVNMSPETIIGTKEDLEASEYSEEDCRWSYIDTRPDSVKQETDPEYEKCYYLKPSIKRGFMNEVVDHVMGLKDDYDGTELYGPVKQVVNSVWGVYGDSDSYGKGYRLFDWRVAESITLYGRKVIQYSAEKYVNAVNNIKDERGYDGHNAYQVGGDTDSVMTSIPFMPNDTRDDQQQIVELAIDACERVNESYDEFAAETFNSDGTYIELEIESYSPYLFVPEPSSASAEGKKRYAKLVAWEEGEWFDPPQFSITGIDTVRSDRAPITRDTVQEVIDGILRIDDPSEARQRVYKVIDCAAKGIERLHFENAYIARPKGMSKPPESYGSASQTPVPTYRGAKYANQNFEWEHMDAGSKPKLLYIDRVRGDWPQSYTADTKEDNEPVDAIAVENPNEVPDEFVIDAETMIEKTLESPISPILSSMGWRWGDARSDTEQSDISTFF